MAATLDVAAVTTYQNVLARWKTGTIRANLLSFVNQFMAAFSEDTANDRPFLNWGAVIASVATQMDATNNSINIEDICTASEYVYNVCFLGFYSAFSATPPPNLITVAQAAALLAAYNAFIE